MRWVLIRDPTGKFTPALAGGAGETQAFLCTDVQADLVQIIKWFVLRWQTEAGNKEMKGTVFVQHLTPAPPQVRVRRSPADIRVQAEGVHRVGRQRRALVPTVAEDLRGRAHATGDPHAGPPHSLGAFAANSAALVQRTTQGTSRLFGPRSALPGAAFTLRGVRAIQLPLAVHRYAPLRGRPYKMPSDSTKPALLAHSVR